MFHKSTSTKITGIISAAVFILLTVFISCDNFAAGSLLKEEIRKEIEYAKAEEVEILISPDVSTQGTTYPSGNKTYKVTDSFTVNLKINDGYQFVKWIVKDYITGQELADILKIDSPYSLETTVTVLRKSTNIQLCPVVYTNLNVTSFKPEYAENGESKDSSIIITFSENLSEDNDLSRIEITSNGVSVSENYKTPVLNGNTITIAADVSNLMDVASGKTITITVLIPDDFCYVKDGIKVPIGDTKTHSFKINSTTTDKTEITCSVAVSKGSVTPSGTMLYNSGDSFTLTYEPEAGYKFYGWEILDGDAKAVDTSILNVEDITAFSTNVKVLGTVKGITITPIAKLIPSASYYPLYTLQGVSCTNNIVIKFNKAMDINNFVDVETGTIKNISITSGLIDYLDTSDGNEPCFKTPELSEDNKTMTIKVNKNRRILSPLDSVSFRDIVVNIKTGALYNNTGLIEREALTDAEDGESFTDDISWTYRVNATTDVIPQFIDLMVYSEVEERGILSVKAFDKWDDADFYSNHTGKNIHFTPKMISSNGLKTLKVKETLIRKVDGTECEVPYPEKSFDLTSAREIETDTYKMDTPIVYDFQSEEDGVVKLVFEIFDVLQYQGTFTMYAIKDTKITKPEVRAYNKPVFNNSIFDDITKSNKQKILTTDVSCSLAEINENINKIYWKIISGKDEWYKDKSTDYLKDNFIFYWGNDKENFSYSASNSQITYDENLKEFTFILPDFNTTPSINNYKDVYYSVYCKDEFNESIQVAEGVITCAPVLQKYYPSTSYSQVEMKWKNPYYNYALNGTSNSITNGIGYLYYTTNENELSELKLLAEIECTDKIYFKNTYATDFLKAANAPYYLYFQGCVSKTKDDLDKGYRTYGNLSKPIKIQPETSISRTYEYNDANAPFTYTWDYANGEPNSGLEKIIFTFDNKDGIDIFDRYDYLTCRISTYANYSIDIVLEEGKNEYSFDPSIIKGNHQDTFSIEITGSKGINKDIVRYYHLNIADYYAFFACDTIAPISSAGLMISSDGHFIKVKEMYDGSSYMKKINDKNFMKLFMVPNTLNISTTNQAKDLLTEETIKNYYIKDIIYNGKYTISFQGYTYYVTTELPELENDNYIVCVYGEDEKNNYRYAPVGIYKKTRLKEKLAFDNIETSGNGKNITLKNTAVEDENQSYAHFNFEKYDEVNGKWGLVQSENQGFNTDLSFNLSTEAFVRVSKCENKNQYYFIANSEPEHDVTSVTVPSYFYTKAGMHTGNVLEGINGYTILTPDEPCLVELVYSTIKDYGANADDWDYNVPPSQKLHPKIYNNQETYVPDLTGVPENAWYTSIFHFADGSSVAVSAKKLILRK